MVENEDWLFRPVMKKMITADKLLDGSIDLAFVALMNEAISVESENNHRHQRHEQGKAQRKRK